MSTMFGGINRQTATLPDHYFREVEAGQLTMGIIGCLPDNVQQAIKSFSIRGGKQHITFAFPFMEDLVRKFDETLDSGVGCEKFQYLTPALFFDRCPEVIHGFETIVTLVPTTNRTSHLVGLLTVNQKDTSEGVRRHLENLIRILVARKTPQNFWQLPLIVTDVNGKLLEQVIDTCCQATLELQSETLNKLYPGRRPQELALLIKEKLLQPVMISYRELLQLNVQEVSSRLTTTDPAYFHSLLELLQSSSCSLVDFRKIHVYFMSPQAESAIKEFWRIWSHEQIASKVFPVTATSNKLGSLYYTSTQGECLSQSVTSLMGSITHVPIKEGLQSVIKCLKNQDLGHSISSEDKERPRSCSCTVCRGDGCTRPTRRLEKSVIGSSGLESAFHRPVSCNRYQPLYSFHSAASSVFDFNGFSYRTKPPCSQAGGLEGGMGPILGGSLLLGYYNPGPLCYKWKMFGRSIDHGHHSRDT